MIFQLIQDQSHWQIRLAWPEAERGGANDPQDQQDVSGGWPRSRPQRAPQDL